MACKENLCKPFVLPTPARLLYGKTILTMPIEYIIQEFQGTLQFTLWNIRIEGS